MGGCGFWNISLKISNPSHADFFFSMGGLRGMIKTYLRSSFRSQDYTSGHTDMLNNHTKYWTSVRNTEQLYENTEQVYKNTEQVYKIAAK